MPCSDSSSSICLQLDPEERFKTFDYAKITCGREITAETGLQTYFFSKSLNEILETPFPEIQKKLALNDEEKEFVLYLEWDALRATIGKYLGIDDAHIDTERCQITAIEHSDEGIEVALVILPPKELPKILPCSLGDNKEGA